MDKAFSSSNKISAYLVIINVLCHIIRSKRVLQRGKKQTSDFLTGIDKTHNDFFLMWSGRKSWRKGLVSDRKGQRERRDEKTKRPQLNEEQTTTRRDRELSEPLPQEGHRERSRSCCWFVETKEARREEQHTSLSYCVGGRREGWRNNLDGLGLIKEETKKRTKKGTQCKIKSSQLGFLYQTTLFRQIWALFHYTLILHQTY